MAKNTTLDEAAVRGARFTVPRSRGAFSGLVLIVLGAWGALIPLLGPIVNFGYTPNSTWHLTAARFWLEILPGVVTVVGGFLMLTAANRITASLGAWLGVAGGAWFVIGLSLRSLFHLGAIGGPISKKSLPKALETLLLFYGLGALILFFAATALGRLGVVSVRDVRAAQRRADEERLDRMDHSDDADTTRHRHNDRSDDRSDDRSNDPQVVTTRDERNYTPPVQPVPVDTAVTESRPAAPGPVEQPGSDQSSSGPSGTDGGTGATRIGPR